MLGLLSAGNVGQQSHYGLSRRRPRQATENYYIVNNLTSQLCIAFGYCQLLRLLPPPATPGALFPMRARISPIPIQGRAHGSPSDTISPIPIPDRRASSPPSFSRGPPARFPLPGPSHLGPRQQAAAAPIKKSGPPMRPFPRWFVAQSLQCRRGRGAATVISWALLDGSAREIPTRAPSGRITRPLVTSAGREQKVLLCTNKRKPRPITGDGKRLLPLLREPTGSGPAWPAFPVGGIRFLPSPARLGYILEKVLICRAHLSVVESRWCVTRRSGWPAVYWSPALVLQRGRGGKG